MKIRRFIQIVPALVAVDANSDYARLLKKICAARFEESIICASRRAGPSAAGEYSLGSLGRPGADTLVLYHHLIGDESAEVFLKLAGCRRMAFYHNITPPSLLSAAPSMAARSHWGLQQLDRLVASVECWMAASEYSACDLTRRGCRRVQVVAHGLDDAKAAGLLAAANRRGAAVPPTVLSVGRMVPHKGLDDVIRVFGLLQKATGNACRLRLVGRADEAEGYVAHLRQLSDAVAPGHIEFATVPPGPALFDEFANAGAYLSMSRHEGFGMPLSEAMFAEVPVVAADFGAVRETVGDAGLVIPDSDAAMFAEALRTVLFDSDVRARLVAAQRRRRLFFTEEALAQRFCRALDQVLSGD